MKVATLTTCAALAVGAWSAPIAAQQSESVVEGFVYLDRNGDGQRNEGERGIRGVAVTNGREVVRTDRDGHYELPAYEPMTVSITKPARFRVPVDEQNIPQFFYHHVPDGSPAAIERFGGLEPTGELPEQVNFPLVRGRYNNDFKIVVSGDTQPYSNNEVSYVRDTLAKEVADMNDVSFVLIEGDIMGDDLGLFPRFKEIMSAAGAPLYFVPGNHDLDFDAETDTHSFDTFKREFGPTYYSFNEGKVHFVVMDDVQYPCQASSAETEFCNDGKTYNGMITEQQLEWLRNDLAQVPKHHLIVLNTHIPLVSYVDRNAVKHSVDNRQALYDVLAGRKVLAMSGHTHTLENFEAGEMEPGWGQPIPFPQIIAGAPSGSWWSGDFDHYGVPRSYQRLGAPRGFLVLEFDGNDYKHRFKATGQPADRQMSVSFLSPSFRGWYDTLLEWVRQDPESRSEIPPVNINDLPDTGILTAEDLRGGTQLIANVWNGSKSSRVYVRFDDRQPIEAARTRDLEQADTIDPFAVRNQMNVMRYALESESGNPRAQGFELYGGAKYGPAAPQPLPESRLTTESNHVWAVDVPMDLEPGVHRVVVYTKEADGHKFQESKTFEVMESRPEPFFRRELFE